MAAGRARRALAKLAAAAAWSATFTAAAAGGLVLHAGTPAGRRALARLVERAAAGRIAGALTVEAIEQAGGRGVSGVDLVIRAPGGAEALRLVDARVVASPWRIALAASLGEPLAIELVRARVVRVSLAPDERGRPAIAAALGAGADAGSAPGAAGAGHHVRVARLEIDRAEVTDGAALGGPLAAAVTGLRGALSLDAGVVTVDVARTAVALQVASVDPHGVAEAHFVAPAPSGGPLSGWAAFDGVVGDAQVALSARTDGKAIDLRAQLPETTGDAIRALAPGAPIFGRVSGELFVTGTPPALDATARLRLGEGELQVGGRVDASAAASATLAAEVRNVDLRSIVPDAPQTSLSGRGSMDAKLVGSSIDGTFAIAADPSEVAGTRLPAGAVRGSFTRGSVDAELALAEPGLPITGKAHATFDPDDATATRVELRASAPIARLDAIPRFAGAPSGRGRFSANASFARGKLAATVDLALDDVRRGSLGARRAHVTAEVRGTPAAPTVSIAARGEDVAVGALHLPELRASAGGDARGGAVTIDAGAADGTRARVRATARKTDAGVELRGATAEVRRGERSFAVSAPAVAIDARGIRAEAIRIFGAGATVTGSVRAAGHAVDVHVEPQEGIALGHLADIFGLSRVVRGGTLDVKRLDAHLGDARESLDLDVDVDGVLLPAVDRVAGHLELAVAAREVRWSARASAFEPTAAAEKRARDEATAAARAALGTLGENIVAAWGASTRERRVDFVSSYGTARLAGEVGAKASWTNATSDGAVAAVGVDLDAPLACARGACTAPAAVLAALLPAAQAPLRSLGGSLGGRVTVQRARADVAPDAALEAWTTGLRGLVGSGDRITRLDGVDLRAAVSATATSGATHAISARLGLLDAAGARGPLVTLTGAVREVPLRELLRAPDRAERLLEGAPITATLAVAPGPVSAWPVALRPTAFTGDVGLTADLSGSLGAPELRLAASARKLRAEDERIDLPLDADLSLEVARGRGTMWLRADRSALARGADPRATHELSADGLVQVDLAAAQKARSLRAGAFRATADVRLDELPLGTIPALASRGIGGAASGWLRVEGMSGAPTLAGELGVSELSIGGARFPAAWLHVTAREDGVTTLDGGLSAHRADACSLRPLCASATTRLAWESGVVPSLDKAADHELRLDAHALGAEGLQPLLRDLFARIGGTIDGHASLALAAGYDEPELAGDLTLRDGLLQIPELGQELRNVTAHVAADGAGALRVAEVSAASGAGRLTAEADVQLAGLSFRSAAGKLEVPEASPVPLSLEGVSFGDAWGRLSATATREPGSSEIAVDLAVPTLHVELPTSSTRALQSLADSPRVRAITRGRDGAAVPARLGLGFSPRAADALVFDLAVTLGDDVRLRRGATLDLRVATAAGAAPLEVTLADRAHVAGAVEVPQGTVQVLGKKFEVDHGGVRFDGDDAGNPDAAVTVRWDAPDGTRIYADYVGRMKTAKIALRAEPARSQAEITSLLLFGTAEEDAYGVGSADSGAAAAGIGGGLAAEGLNSVLAEVAPVSARVDTSVAANPRPEVAVQLSRSVTAQLAYSTGVPPPGQNPDRVLVTLDWTFRRQWSVSTTLGDQGSSLLDLVWQYRY